MSRYTARPVRNNARPAQHAVYDTTTRAFVTEPTTPELARAAARFLRRQDRTTRHSTERERNAAEADERRKKRAADAIAADLALVAEHGSVQAAADAVGRSKQSFYRRPGFAEAVAAILPQPEPTVASIMLPPTLAKFARRWVKARGADDLLSAVAERVTDASEAAPKGGPYRAVPLDSAVWLACGGPADADAAKGRFRAALRQLMRDVPKPEPIARHTSKGPDRWTEDALRALIAAHHGSVKEMAAAAGVAGPSISTALARRGLAEEARAARFAAGIQTLADEVRACAVDA